MTPFEGEGRGSKECDATKFENSTYLFFATFSEYGILRSNLWKCIYFLLIHHNILFCYCYMHSPDCDCMKRRDHYDMGEDWLDLWQYVTGGKICQNAHDIIFEWPIIKLSQFEMYHTEEYGSCTREIVTFESQCNRHSVSSLSTCKALQFWLINGTKTEILPWAQAQNEYGIGSVQQLEGRFLTYKWI